MKYGYFDDDRKEYVINNPVTPASWSNYLGSTEYGAIITNNAGGYSFYKSAAQGRFTRFRTNSIPMDQPGRYIYLRDQDSGDYWSNAWQPVAKDLKEFETECRHGTAYTHIISKYSGIITETTYFVPLDQTFECWLVKLKNLNSVPRNLRLFTFVEYASNWNLWQDIINLQYTQYILTMDIKDNIIDHGTNVYLPPQPDNFEEGGQARHTFLGISGAQISGFDTDRNIFIGKHRSYHNPEVVTRGVCSNSLAVGDNGCACVQLDVLLEPGQSTEFVVVMGIGKAGIEGKEVIKKCSNIGWVRQELNRLKTFWHEKLTSFKVETPDPAMNSMLNAWSPYNCLITYAWSRAASLVYAGERDGLGYRDSVQDLLGVLPSIPDEAVRRLELMLTGQLSSGGALPVIKPFSHKPGQIPVIQEEEYRSDDCLWLFNAIPAYVKETGDIAFFKKILPYADKGKDTVLLHMKKAIEFNLDRSGDHGLPCGLAADWNDCLMLGHHGESVFVAFQLRFALKTFMEICELLDEKEEIIWAGKKLELLDHNIQKHCWDGDWFIRAFREDGLKFGSAENEEGKIWLNPQTWAVISGYLKKDDAIKVLSMVYEKLFSAYGLLICDPPYEKAGLDTIKATLFNKGMKENGAIFCHTQGWAIMAECMTGNGERAYKYYKAYLPASYNEEADLREVEPYVYCQSTHGKHSPRYGKSRLPWLSGAATWAYYAATQYILGIRPGYNGISIDPCIPGSWREFKVERYFRKKQLNITVQNPAGITKGVKQILLNGTILHESFIPFNQLIERNEIIVTMGEIISPAQTHSDKR